MLDTISCYFDEDKWLLFIGRKSFLRTNTHDDLILLQKYLDEHPHSFKTIALSYDLKNEMEDLRSSNHDRITFPNVVCWEPEHVLSFHNDKWEVLQSNIPDEALNMGKAFIQEIEQDENGLPSLAFQPTESKDSYLEAIKGIQSEIQYGNSYEINYCQEFYAENVPDFLSSTLIKKLFETTKAPFSAYLKFDEFEVFSGSPERYLKKKGSRLISQPIKGTIARGHDKATDDVLKETLLQSKKDISENVMIVDLVRNDLSRIAQKGSVNVEELAGVHSFNTVHHLVSTIVCELKSNTSFSEILQATFPMGSMTGAPKTSTMNIIERFEQFKRGIYSGSIGYIDPNDDFDLNVVIRSLVKNNLKKVMTCGVGGAITNQSVALNEYDECQVKVAKILQLFSNPISSSSV